MAWGLTICLISLLYKKVNFCDFSVAVETKRVPVKNISVTNIFQQMENTKEFLEEFLKDSQTPEHCSSSVFF